MARCVGVFYISFAVMDDDKKLSQLSLFALVDVVLDI